jgi:hypothetical protein
MKAMQKIFTDPIAAAIVAVHWLLFVFALFYEKNLIFSEAITFHGPEPVIYNFLLFLNVPAISVMEFAVLPFLSFFERNLLTKGFEILIFVVLSSLQWFCLGHLTGRVVEIYKPKEVKLSLK